MKRKNIFRPLTPLKKDENRELPQFGVIDIESRNWTEFLLNGFYAKTFETHCDGKTYLSRTQTGEIFETSQDNDEFCQWLFSKEQPFDDIYAHFGGKFDFLFMLKSYFGMRNFYFVSDMIPRGSGVLGIDVSSVKKSNGYKTDSDLIRELTPEEKISSGKTYLIKNRTIKFWDSAAILPFSLGSLTKNFKTEHRKLDFDHEDVEAVTDEMRKYHENDLRGLYEVMEKYFEWPLIRSAGYAKTMAGQAMRVYQTYLKKPISSLTPEVDAFIRKGYFGGRTEIFKPAFKQVEDDKILSIFDVNSLYPYVMMSHEFPGKCLGRGRGYSEDWIGFFDVEIEVPEMYAPPLGVLWKIGHTNKLIFPTGLIRGVWSSLEINYAVSCGAKIKKAHGGYCFSNAGLIFSDYIKDLYEIRKKSPKGSVDDILAKLLMNSTYGRFGINWQREQLRLVRKGQAGIKNIEMLLKNGSIAQIESFPVELDKSFVHVATAAWVTSGARIHMHKLMQQAPEALYNMDTDSLFTTHNYASNQDDLGELKLEDRQTEWVGILPKTYVGVSTKPKYESYGLDGKKVFDENGKEIKTIIKRAAKGFDKKSVFWTPEDFYLYLEGELRVIAKSKQGIFPLRTAMRHGDFLKSIGVSVRKIQSNYDKRRVFKRPWAQIWDTEPWHIKNGQIENWQANLSRSK